MCDESIKHGNCISLLGQFFWKQGKVYSIFWKQGKVYSIFCSLKTEALHCDYLIVQTDSSSMIQEFSMISLVFLSN